MLENNRSYARPHGLGLPMGGGSLCAVPDWSATQGKGKWRIKGGRVRRKRRCLPLGLRQTIEALKGFSNVLS